MGQPGLEAFFQNCKVHGEIHNTPKQDKQLNVMSQIMKVNYTLMKKLNLIEVVFLLKVFCSPLSEFQVVK